MKEEKSKMISRQHLPEDDLTLAADEDAVGGGVVEHRVDGAVRVPQRQELHVGILDTSPSDVSPNIKSFER